LCSCVGEGLEVVVHQSGENLQGLDTYYLRLLVDEARDFFPGTVQEQEARHPGTPRSAAAERPAGVKTSS